VGKRYGVAGTRADEKATLSVCTFLAMNIGGYMFVLADFLRVGARKRTAVFEDGEWCRRLPIVIGCGVLSGLGGLAATYALAVASRNASALISVIENGTYSLFAVVLITCVFHERPGVLQIISVVLILTGVCLAESSESKEERKHPETEPLEGASAPHATYSDCLPGASVQKADAWSWRSCRCLPCSTAVMVAALAGLLWSFGSLGKRFGVGGAPGGLKVARSACTLFLYNSAVLVPGFLAVFGSAASGGLQGTVSRKWCLCTCPVVFNCGLLSGFGSVLATYAFALAAKNESGVLAMVENGVYTALAALLIALLWRERPSRKQLLSALLVLAGVVLAYAG